MTIPTALPLLPPLVGPQTTVLTIQNGVESAEQVAAVVGERQTIGGATYIATAIDAPGVIRQTGSHRRVVFGEVFNAPAVVSDRVRAIETLMKAADIHAEAVPNAWPAIWEKFTFLAPFAAFTGGARLPLGPIWNDPDGRRAILQAAAEVEAVARASGIDLPGDLDAATREVLLDDSAIHARVAADRSLTGPPDRSRVAPRGRRPPWPSHRSQHPDD